MPLPIHNVQALREKDPLEWASVYDRYVSSTFSFIAALVKNNRELAEELHQQTWLTAMSAIDQYSPERGEFRAWLFGIAKKRVYLALRSEGRSTNQSEQEADSLSENVLLPDEVLEQVERGSAVQAAMQALSEDAREVLVGKYVENLSVQQIADQMGRTPKSVESLLTRSRDKMRSLLHWYFPHTSGGVSCKTT